ncbi:hypothetical protein [Dactylosporangium sp. NPDC051484]|uniref:hypothetical protein n=1 Tax=Dactylosporangium sp. NPDC051484 TaxID=3154942 RepID=UPI00344D6F25
MDPTVEPLSTGVQIALRLPVIIIALAGALLGLLMIRRMGVLSGILAAAGSLIIAADQAANVAWVLHLRSMTSGGDLDIDTFNTVNNAYLVADAVLITIGMALVVASFVLRRPATAGPVVAAGPAADGFGSTGAPPTPGFDLPPGSPPPWSAGPPPAAQ